MGKDLSPLKAGKIEITAEMAEAGAEAILEELGGVDAFFSAPDLAVRVYRAMAEKCCLPERPRCQPHNP